MENVKKALDFLDITLRDRDQHHPISFSTFLSHVAENPTLMLRGVFQVFHDMVKTCVGEGVDEYPEDQESVGFYHYDCSKLFVEKVDHPFFADRIFANRFVDLAEALKRGAQQNKIYIFDGPPGCGKSTFLNNLLKKFEEYANTAAGFQYETLWRLDQNALGISDRDGHVILDRLAAILGRLEPAGPGPGEPPERAKTSPSEQFTGEWSFPEAKPNFVEVACPSHDHPILLIPKVIRRTFVEELLEGQAEKDQVLGAKEFEWVFSSNPCTICQALYNAILEKLDGPQKVLEMIFARPYRFNRRLGEGISVFNPGDPPMRQTTLSNAMIQGRINILFRDSNQVPYIFSRYAKTNNGIYALMDIKTNNTERLIELHNIISEGVHKVEFLEENVNSLFMAVMNPEDKVNVANIPSFSDRIQYIEVPYVLDYKTEVAIYRHVFGQEMSFKFLPRVLNNFARIIISTRMDVNTPAIKEWISKPEEYDLYCDRDLLLLKMDLYTGFIPPWLSEEDRKSFTAKRRQKVLEDSKKEGKQGFSGRDSIKIFGNFLSKFAKEDALINMSMLVKFFEKMGPEFKAAIPERFLDSLLRMYNYLVLQEVKESLYYYNEDQISRDIQNYLFALNFELGTKEKCVFTGDRLEITDDFLKLTEARLLSGDLEQGKRLAFRQDAQKEYTSITLTQEVLLEGKNLKETKQFEALHERYVHNLKQKVLDPFLENENFRRAINDYETEAFKTYDYRIREDVTFLINNLVQRYGYSPKGAQSVCMYVIDQDLARTFAK